MSSRAGVVVALVAQLLGCGHAGGDGAPDAGDGAPAPTIAPRGAVLEAAENQAAPATSSSARAAEGTVVAIPDGKLVVGSTPGDAGRDPTLEPALLEVEIAAFDIDRDLFPSAPGGAPLVGLSRPSAQQRCAEKGRRLCSELEWERACKGPGADTFAGRGSWDPACARDPGTCPSGFGVLGLGVSVREWTSSDVTGVGETASAAAVRGARGDAAAVDHRCARRSMVDPKAGGDDIGFRCCGGAVPEGAPTIPAATAHPTFRKVELAAAELQAMLRSVPQLKKLEGDVKYFDESSGKDIASRSDAGAAPGDILLTSSPLLWSPVPGEEILVVTGAAGDDAFVVAFHRLPGDRHRLGSSMLLRKEKGPIALAYNPNVKRRLSWTACWECPGEWGSIHYREENRVVITQE